MSGSVFIEPPLSKTHYHHHYVRHPQSHLPPQWSQTFAHRDSHHDTPLGPIVLLLNMTTATILFIVNGCRVIVNSLIISTFYALLEHSIHLFHGIN